MKPCRRKPKKKETEINQYKALDIKLMADGVETEPEGDVQVRFKNVNLEKVDEKKEAEQEKAEEQSMVKKAVRKVKRPCLVLEMRKKMLRR